MPIYEYECMNCRKEFEVIRSISDEGEVVCSLCGAKDLKKIVSRVNSQGWSSFIDGMEAKIKSPHLSTLK